MSNKDPHRYDVSPKTSKTKPVKSDQATELEYLKWFRINADFGPANSDVKSIMNDQFTKETGKKVPKGWQE